MSNMQTLMVMHQMSQIVQRFSLMTISTLFVVACGNDNDDPSSQQSLANSIDGCEIRPLPNCQSPIAGLRDKCKAPFSPDSIWNTSLSASATAVPASIGAATQKVYGDDTYWIVASQNDPNVEWINPS